METTQSLPARNTLFPGELRAIKLERALIIEYRTDGDTVVGEAVYGRLNGDGSFGIDWKGAQTGNRTTVFHPESWRVEIQGGVVMLHRTGQDAGDTDLPWRTSNLYTIVPRTAPWGRA